MPAGVGHRPKWRIALGLLERAKANGVTGIALADADYGSVAEFRAGLAAQGWAYAVAVRPTVVVIAADEDLGEVPPWRGTGNRPRRPARVRHLQVKAAAARRWAADRAGDFRRVVWRAGSKGPLVSRFAAWRVRPAGKVSSRRMPGDECWLLAEWPQGEEGPAKFYLSNLPAGTPLRRLVRAAKGRWWVEKDQADCTSRRRWGGTRRAGYHRRDGVARAGRVVPATPRGRHRRSRMPDTTRRPVPPRT